MKMTEEEKEFLEEGFTVIAPNRVILNMPEIHYSGCSYTHQVREKEQEFYARRARKIKFINSLVYRLREEN